MSTMMGQSEEESMVPLLQGSWGQQEPGGPHAGPMKFDI